MCSQETLIQRELRRERSGHVHFACMDRVEQSLGPAVGRQLPGLQGGFLTWQSPDLGSDESSEACSSVAVS